MNRTLYPVDGSLLKRTCDLYLRLTAGTSGAIPAVLDSAEGIASVVLDNTGIISIHLQDSYVSLEKMDGGIKQVSTFDATKATRVVEASTSDVTDPTDPKVVINLLAQDGTSKLDALTNMAAGDVLTVHLSLTH